MTRLVNCFSCNRESKLIFLVTLLIFTSPNIIKSIYFFDPNGIRLELTTPAVDADAMQVLASQAHAQVRAWTDFKSQRRAAAA